MGTLHAYLPVQCNSKRMQRPPAAVPPMTRPKLLITLPPCPTPPQPQGG